MEKFCCDCKYSEKEIVDGKNHYTCVKPSENRTIDMSGEEVVCSDWEDENDSVR